MNYLILAILFAVLIAVLQIGILSYAYEKMGVPRGAAYAILFCSLLGAKIDLPVATLRPPPHQEVREFVRWGQRHRIPVLVQPNDTRLMVNVGGALIPAALSLYLIVRNRIYVSAAIGVAIVSLVVNRLASPVEGLGIQVNIVIPPIAAAVVALLLSREHAAPLAYAAGCLGTLIGADVMNFAELAELNAQDASIGGAAGTFDAVFLTGILAVLLAGIPGPPRLASPPPELPPEEPRSYFDAPSAIPLHEERARG